MVAKTSGRVGEAGGWDAGSFQVMWYSFGFSGLCCTVMAAVASSSGVHRCGLWSRGLESDGVAVSPAVER